MRTRAAHILVALLCVWSVPLSSGARSSVRIDVTATLLIRQTALNPTSAVVRGDSLWVADNGPGLAVYDLGSGRRVGEVSLGDGARSSTVAVRVGAGPGGVVVRAPDWRWHRFDHSWELSSGSQRDRASPSSGPVVFADRIAVFGWAGEALTGGPPAWLFVRYDDGTIIPVAEEPAGLAHEEYSKRWIARGTLAGGVTALPDGGWAAVDPFEYRLLLFDERDRLRRTVGGANPDFRSPSIATVPRPQMGDDDSMLELYRWWTAQTLAKRPAVIGDDLIGVVVGLPAEGGTQRHELDLYRLDGTTVASGIELPGVVAARLIVADAEPGRLVLLGMERNWPRADEMTVWEVGVEASEPTGEE